MVHIIVPPMGLQNSSIPWSLILAPPLGTLCSVYWWPVSHGYFDPTSKKDQSMHTVALFLLEFHVGCELYLGYSKFWAKIHLSASAYLVCSFVIGLPRSG